MLPTVDFCGLKLTRLLIGANPFGGYSHQNPERDKAMREYYTCERIKATWDRALKAGINTMVTNNETPHVVQAVTEYLKAGGRLQWIAQINGRTKADVCKSIDEAVAIGCKAIYLHGALVDDAFSRKDSEAIKTWCDHARSLKIPAGVAGHSPQAHLWVHGLGFADFHAVCFFNCGSLHSGKGNKFRLADMKLAVDAIHAIKKPCIAYKIMGAGRIDAHMAFEYAFANIKPGDVVNVGMYRGDKNDMVEENIGMVQTILGGA